MALMKCPSCKSEVGNKIAVCPTCGYEVWKKKDENYFKKIQEYNAEAVKNINANFCVPGMNLLNSALQEYRKFEKYLEEADAKVDITQSKSYSWLKHIYLNFGVVKSKSGSPHYNITEAINDYERSGDLGEVSGYLNIAHMYVKGETQFKGIDKNLDAAKQWYLKAFAFDNNNVAINNLGVAYGEDGDQKLGAFYCWCAYKCGNDKALDNYNAYKIYLVAEVQRYIEAINNVSRSNIEKLTDDYINFCSKNADIYNHKQIEQLKKQDKGPITMPSKPKRMNLPMYIGIGCLFFTILYVFLIISAINDGDSFGWMISFGIIMLLGTFGGFSQSSKRYYKELYDYNLAQKDFEAYKSQKLLERKQEQERIARVRAQQAQNKKDIEKAEREIAQKRAENFQKGIPCCPKCASTRIVTMSRGYDWFWGFIGSNEPVNVCQSCGHKFKPGT